MDTSESVTRACLAYHAGDIMTGSTMRDITFLPVEVHPCDLMIEIYTSSAPHAIITNQGILLSIDGILLVA